MTYKEKRAERLRMGLCTECGGLRINPAYKLCEKCRSKRRAKERQKVYDAISEQRETTSTHKCWTCEWGRFEGDRFFCPFIEGTCVKENKK